MTEPVKLYLDPDNLDPQNVVTWDPVAKRIEASVVVDTVTAQRMVADGSAVVVVGKSPVRKKERDP